MQNLHKDQENKAAMTYHSNQIQRTVKACLYELLKILLQEEKYNQ